MSRIYQQQFALAAALLFVAVAQVVVQTSAFSPVGITTSTSNNVNNNNAMSSSSSSSTLLFMSSMAAPMLPEGLVKTIVNGGNTGSPPIGRGDIATVKYTCYSAGADDDSDSANNNNNVLIARSDSQKMVVGDGSMVPGWDAALRSMIPGERAVVRVTDPKLGYGSDKMGAEALEALGVPLDASGNTQLEFDIQILKVQLARDANQVFDMNFDAMALEDDTPKTAEDIAAAYQVRMDNKEPEKEGLEGWIDTVKNYYFFGFFEGETGEEAPWYLKPSITFPIAFGVVGAAFWVSVGVGAISEKGAQSIDELDRIVTTTLVMMNSGGVQLPM